MKSSGRLSHLLLPALLFLPLPVSAAPLDRPVGAMVAPLESLGVFQGVVRITRGDRLLFERAYGFANAELRVPNRVDGVFRIASVSKLVTQIAVGRLVEEGKLSLDDPIARWIPEMKDRRVTIRQALVHRGGIPHENSIPYDEEAAAQGLDSLVRRIAAEPLDFEPGTRRRYSNGGYALLAAVIERASGRTYADYLRREVLDPLGIMATRHERDGEVIARRAYGYQPSPRRRSRPRPTSTA